MVSSTRAARRLRGRSLRDRASGHARVRLLATNPRYPPRLFVLRTAAPISPAPRTTSARAVVVCIRGSNAAVTGATTTRYAARPFGWPIVENVRPNAG